jgi:Na+/glutamate symporter
MILLRGVVVWWTAQIPQQQRPDRDNTNRAGSHDLDVRIVMALTSLNNNQIIKPYFSAQFVTFT